MGSCQPPSLKELACFEVGGRLGWRIEVVGMRVRERVRGREDARRRRRGRVTLDLKSLRACAPCQVRAVHRVGRPKDCRLREDMHHVHEEKGSGPMARGFPVVQSEWPGGGGACSSMARRAVMCCKMEVAAEQRPEGIQDMGMGSGGAMEKKIG